MKRLVGASRRLAAPRPEIVLALSLYLLGVPFSPVAGLMALTIQAAFRLPSGL
jgi:hypothetical protein